MFDVQILKVLWKSRTAEVPHDSTLNSGLVRSTWVHNIIVISMHPKGHTSDAVLITVTKRFLDKGNRVVGESISGGIEGVMGIEDLEGALIFSVSYYISW